MKIIRLVRSAILPLLFALPVSARYGYVSLHSSTEEQHPSSDETVSPGIARLFLAQRLGVSDFHHLSGADEGALAFLGDFRDDGQEIWFDDAKVEQRKKRRVLLFLEGVEEPRALVDKAPFLNTASGFWIANPPASGNARFMHDLAKQSDYTFRSQMPSQPCHGDKFQIPANLRNEKTTNAGCHTFLHTKLNQPHTGPVTTSNILDTLTSLHSAASSSSAEVITIFLPQSPSTSLLKRSTGSQSWGTYMLPHGDQSSTNPKNRENSFFSPTHPSRVRALEDDLIGGTAASASPFEPPRPSIDDDRPAKERPAKDRLSQSSEYDVNEEDPDDPDRPKRPTKSATTSSTPPPKDTSPPRGILPQCHTSEAECNRATHSCSGHGMCKLTFDISHPSGDKGSVSTKTKCYSCLCDAETSQRDGKKKTTRWTGPACQKKDVSTEFWLIAAVTVGLVGAIAWAIGLLSSMGAQELPSVIGAGVTGLGARAK